MSPALNTFNVQQFLSQVGVGRQSHSFAKGALIYSQGDDCDSIFCILDGMVRLTIVSEEGKEATIAVLRTGDFAGEECVSTVQPFRSSSAQAMCDCILMRIAKKEMQRVLRDEPAMSAMFVAYLLAKTSKIQADLVDQLFNSSEKRLARTLLLLASFGKDDMSGAMVPQISQETLAAMIGSTRSRVNFFLNRFRRLGFIEYDAQIKVHKSLLQVVLHDRM